MNASSPIVFTVDGISIADREEQWANAEVPMVWSDAGSVTFVNDLHWANV